MPTTSVIPRVTCALAMLCTALIGLSPSTSHAQDAGPAPVAVPAAMPTDAKELMRVVSEVNGLTGDDARPWHLRATYSLLDEKGNVTDRGTYEEFWAGPTKFKRTFTGGNFSQTDFGTEKGIFRIGQRGAIPILVSDIRRDFVTPAPSSEGVDHSTFNLLAIDAKGTKLSCLRFATLPDPGLVYCIPPDRPIVVINTYLGESIQVIRERILEFHGQFVAGDLNFIRGGKTLLTAHLENLETLKPSDQANLAPPAEAVLLPRRVNISAGVAQGMLKKHPAAPIYPRPARDAGVAGTVVLEAAIGIDGHIADLEVVSGPPMLRQSALDAVQTWTYRPYLLNGDPVEVHTTINVVFTLGR